MVNQADMAIDSSSVLPLQKQGDKDATTETQPEQPLTMSTSQQSLTYAKAVSGGSTANRNQNPAIQWTPVGEHDLVTGERNGEPSLQVSAAFKAKLCAPWQKTLVVRLLGLRIGFVTLCNRLKNLWRPTGSMEVKDLDHDCYLVKLDNEHDYLRALTDGPWVIFDHYLVVQQWSPKFKASDPLPRTMIVWVQFPALKIHFYHKEVLTTLGNLIGRTIKLDYHTLNQERAKFARLAVEVDLSRHLVPRIWLDDEWQKVEYENLPEVCFECGKIGHSSSSCPQLLSVVPLSQSSPLDVSPTSPTTADDPNPGFGPWMLVTRKSRRNPRDLQRKGKVENGLGNLGNQSPISVSKDGKNGPAVREGNSTSPPLFTPNGHLPPKNPSQEKKGNNDKKISEETRKGKSKVVSEGNNKGKGLLGAGPKPSKKGDGGPKQVSVVGPSSSSGHDLGLEMLDRNAQEDGAAQEPHGESRLTMSQTLAIRTVTGQNGTVMQIVEDIPPVGQGAVTKNSSPSVA
ncbi:unnamed protein product [Linum tenue]|uniref:CCHC-type domain-containing protein n=1 Tax=Linum tenue TaxID=586396 RepID=A0AAV0GS30_9ROSI|nr:unnamed protein product [Linum tenue]